jgi:hypothetical protein
MRLLIFILLLAFFSSCTPQYPITPTGAYEELKKSFKNNDYDKTISLLTDESISKIKKTSAVFSSMDDSSLNSAAAAYGINPERLKKLSVKDYLAVYSNSGKQNVLLSAFESNILGIDKKGNEALITLDNGMKLRFLKTGPYWKFDMTEF